MSANANGAREPKAEEATGAAEKAGNGSTAAEKKSAAATEDETCRVVATQCTDWSLNDDIASAKQFWWNKTYSISVWQVNLKVAEPISQATDDIVWSYYLQHQFVTVYKMCVVCGGPEGRDDVFACCYCGGQIHTECSTPADPGQIAWKACNKKFAERLRVCHNCNDSVPEKKREVKPQPDGARRAIIRALASDAEYPAHVSAGLKALLQDVQSHAVNDEDGIKKCQALLNLYFQPGNSASLMEKKNIESKANGLGVRAKADIPRFTIVGIYPGYEDPLSGEQAKVGRPQPKYSLVDLNCADFFNDVFDELKGTFTPFLNEPNEHETSNCAWIQETILPEGRLSVMTVRDIKAGEEMMIGYGPLYPRCYPHNYDAYAYHIVDGYTDPPCFALWHWTSADESNGDFVCYCGYDAEKNTYSYWATEDELAAKPTPPPQKTQK